MFKGSLVALVTPFDQTGEKIDYSALEKLLNMHVFAKTDAIVLAGTTGEGPLIEKNEFQKLLEFSLKVVSGKTPIIASTGSNSTKKSVEMTRLAKEIGVAAAMCIAPYYNKPEDRGLLLHYKEIESVGLPYILYHHPGRCGKEMLSKTLIELSSYDYLVGFKECSNNINLIKRLIEKGNGKPLFCGDDDKILDRIDLGMEGSISVFANLFPEYWKRICDHAINGNREEAEDLFKKIKGLIWSLFIETNPQGIKYALHLKEGIQNTLRLPLTSVSLDTAEEIKEELQKFEEASFQNLSCKN
jgi:4-hydroxy-tetrahydrodipicolinate synthase